MPPRRPARRKRSLGPVEMPQVALPALTRHDDGTVTGGTTYDAMEFLDLDNCGVRARDTAFVECAVTGGRWDEADLRGLRLADCVLCGVGATIIGMTGATWRDVIVRDCRWGAVEAPGATWTRVGITGGRIDYLNLRGATVEESLFEGTVIGELDLTGASAHRVTVTGSRIERLVLHEARLSDVDLTGADVAAIDAPSGLRGARITRAQAYDLAEFFAAELGITVVE